MLGLSYVKLSKCSFCQKEVHFLGHIVSRSGIRADPTKTSAVANWPVPTTTKEVQKFLITIEDLCLILQQTLSQFTI